MALPGSHCLPNSIPLTPLNLPFKLVQTQQQLVMLFEHYDPPRQFYTDDRGLPKDLDPSWMGYSMGKWQSYTLAVESARFNGKTRLDTLDVNPSTPLVLGCSILVEQCPPAVVHSAME